MFSRLKVFASQERVSGFPEKGLTSALIFSSFPFWISLPVSFFKEFLAILSVFPFFPKDFRGSASTGNPCFFGGFRAVFQKARKRRSGWGSQGNLRGSPEDFRGSLGNFRGIFGMLLCFTVRELPGKSPENFWGSLGNFWGSPGISRSSGEPDSLPVTRQICLQFLGLRSESPKTVSNFQAVSPGAQWGLH